MDAVCSCMAVADEPKNVAARVINIRHYDPN